MLQPKQKLQIDDDFAKELCTFIYAINKLFSVR